MGNILNTLKGHNAKIGDTVCYRGDLSGEFDYAGGPIKITDTNPYKGDGIDLCSGDPWWEMVTRISDYDWSTLTITKPSGGPSPTKEELQEYFIYDDGELVRIKSSTTRPDTLGKPFGGMTGTGYIQGWFKNKLYYLHHLIWIYHNGTLPKGVVDHINRDKTDNRIENLREATVQQNTFNRQGNTNAVSQFKGVSRKRDKWRARITVDGVDHSLGSFDTEIEAGLAYRKAAQLLQGDYSIE